jgi:hypothetical protein
MVWMDGLIDGWASVARACVLCVCFFFIRRPGGGEVDGGDDFFGGEGGFGVGNPYEKTER